MSKKLLTLALVLALAFTFTACKKTGCVYVVIEATNQITCVPPVGAK